MSVLAVFLVIYFLLLMVGKFLDRFLWSPFLVLPRSCAGEQENDYFFLGFRIGTNWKPQDERK